MATNFIYNGINQEIPKKHSMKLHKMFQIKNTAAKKTCSPFVQHSESFWKENSQYLVGLP